MAVDKSGERVQRMFAAIADEYDRMNHLLSMNIDKRWRSWAVKKVKPRGSDPILDVCTGTGDLALAYWKATEGAVPIVATDFCSEMLEIGRKKKLAAGINGTLEFVEADTMDLPFPDDRFQIVTAAFGLRNVSDTNRGLSEMTRVCRPDGQVAILEFSMPQRQPFRAIYGCYFRHILPRIGQLLARNDEAAYAYLPASVGVFPHGDALADQLRNAGLHEVRYYPLTMGIATLYVGKKP